MPVLAWHLVTKDQDYAFARPGLVAHKQRKLELSAGAPSRRGNFGAPGAQWSAQELVTTKVSVSKQPAWVDVATCIHQSAGPVPQL